VPVVVKTACVVSNVRYLRDDRDRERVRRTSSPVPRDCIYVFGGYPTEDCVLAFDPVSLEWRTLPPMPTPRYGHSIAELDGMIYVMGGYHKVPGLPASFGELAVVERFHPARELWSSLPPMSQRRDEAAAAAAGGCVYAAAEIGQVECFDPSLNRWSNLRPLACGRMGHSDQCRRDTLRRGWKMLGW
jgi:hypothetical protein